MEERVGGPVRQMGAAASVGDPDRRAVERSQVAVASRRALAVAVASRRALAVAVASRRALAVAVASRRALAVAVASRRALAVAVASRRALAVAVASRRALAVAVAWVASRLAAVAPVAMARHPAVVVTAARLPVAATLRTRDARRSRRCFAWSVPATESAAAAKLTTQPLRSLPSRGHTAASMTVRRRDRRTGRRSSRTPP